jgi:hypothetical protein
MESAAILRAETTPLTVSFAEVLEPFPDISSFLACCACALSGDQPRMVARAWRAMAGNNSSAL